MCMFISNGLTIPKRSPAWPTQSLKLLRVQVHRVTIFPIWLKMGLSADTRYVQGTSNVMFFVQFKFIIIMCNLFFITLISDGFFSWVFWLHLFMDNSNVAVCARLPWGLAKWREAVEEDRQSAIYKATRPVDCSASQHEPRPDQLHNLISSHQWQSSPIFRLLQ